MSTKLYVHRIRKSDLWPLVRAVRELYAQEAPYVITFNKALGRLRDAATAEEKVFRLKQMLRCRIEMVKRKDHELEDDTVSIQIFERGNRYYFRVLEMSWMFWNTKERLVFDGKLEEIVYDDRTDVPTDQKKNQQHAEWIDKKITAGEYLTVEIVSGSMVREKWFRNDEVREQWREIEVLSGQKLSNDTAWTEQERTWIKEETWATYVSLFGEKRAAEMLAEADQTLS